MSKIILAILLLAAPAWAYHDPWTDCNRWGDDIQSIILCRKSKMQQHRLYQQRFLAEQERALLEVKRQRRK